MDSFNQLFNQYTHRLGISDSELARSVGVSRQTIFRWREGHTSRPRDREIVLALAKKLRLSPEEQNALLLAAGFQPVTGSYIFAHQPQQNPLHTTAEPRLVTAPNPKVDPALSAPARANRYLKWAVAVLAAALLAGGIVAGWNRFGFFKGPERVAVVPAAPDETLILITQFANYASNQLGYNVAGRLAEAVQQEIDAMRLQQIRVAVWPDVVEDQPLAWQAGNAVSATLVIYGEYDAGWVVVKFELPHNAPVTGPALSREVLNAQELSATINADLPQQVRTLALMTLGQVYLNQGNVNGAQQLLTQARDNAQFFKHTDPQTWAVVNFYLGTAYHYQYPPRLDQAIKAYTQAITAWPQMVSSRLNRIAAYQATGNEAYLPLALADADIIVAAAPEWAAAYNNRASIRLVMGGSENVALALADLDGAIKLDPQLPETYLNRAQAHLMQQLPMAQVAPDLHQALALRPHYASALHFLCWGYAIENQPATALPYCDQAIAGDPRPEFFDSRAIAYALAGNYPAAIAGLENYLAWLNGQNGDLWNQERERRRQWLAALAANQNPFTPELLAQLKQEFSQ